MFTWGTSACVIMGMITRVRGRLHSITKLDPQMKDEKIAETGEETKVQFFTLDKKILDIIWL